jgi:hypothetical protein
VGGRGRVRGLLETTCQPAGTKFRCILVLAGCIKNITNPVPAGRQVVSNNPLGRCTGLSSKPPWQMAAACGVLVIAVCCEPNTVGMSPHGLK